MLVNPPYGIVLGTVVCEGNQVDEYVLTSQNWNKFELCQTNLSFPAVRFLCAGRQLIILH